MLPQSIIKQLPRLVRQSETLEEAIAAAYRNLPSYQRHTPAEYGRYQRLLSETMRPMWKQRTAFPPQRPTPTATPTATPTPLQKAIIAKPKQLDLFR